MNDIRKMLKTHRRTLKGRQLHLGVLASARQIHKKPIDSLVIKKKYKTITNLIIIYGNALLPMPLASAAFAFCWVRTVRDVDRTAGKGKGALGVKKKRKNKLVKLEIHNWRVILVRVAKVITQTMRNGSKQFSIINAP